MQISSTQAHVSSSLQETSPKLENKNVESQNDPSEIQDQKKKKPVFFAKLLEGLNVKLKKETSVENSKKPSMGKEAGEETGKNLSMLDVKNKVNSDGVPKIEISENEVFGFFQQKSELDPQGLKLLKFESDSESNTAQKTKNLTRTKESSSPEMNQQLAQKKSAFSAEAELENHLAAQKRPEKSDSEALKATNVEKTRGQVLKTANHSVDSNLEAESSALVRLVNLRQKTADKNELSEGGSRKLQEIRGKRGREKPGVEFQNIKAGETKETMSFEASKSQVLKPLTPEVEILVDLNSGKAKADTEQGVKTTIPTSKGFEDALARELRGDLSSNIVRQAAIIVRDGNEGTIRLSLRPGSLGDVKIRLELTENKITGHIVLESNEALRAFERELPVLEKAFRDSGFSETNLEMSLAQDQGGWNFESPNQGQERELPVFSPILATPPYQEETDWVLQPGENVTGKTSVYLLV